MEEVSKLTPVLNELETTTKKAPAKKVNVNPKSKKDAQYDKDHQMVKGRFTFHEVPGGTLIFPYVKYKGDTTRPYKMLDGEVLEVPYMVAKHLNTKGRYPIHKHTMDEDGKYTQKIGQWVSRFSFQPLGFFDDHDVQPVPAGKNLITVEHGKLI